MSRQIAIRIPDEELADLDAAVARGEYASRADAVRIALSALLREHRERRIDEAYRRGYGANPQEEWVGRAGLAAFAAFVETEERDSGPL